MKISLFLHIGAILAANLIFFGVAYGQSNNDALTPERAEELQEIEQRLEAKEKEESRLKDEAKKHAREVTSLRKRMVETAEALQGAERRIATINEEIVRLETEEKDIVASLEGQQENLGDVLAALQSLERSRPPAILVNPDDASTAARTALLLSEAAPAIEAKAARLKTSLDTLRTVRASLNDERVAFEKTNAEVKDRRKLLAGLLKEKQRERDVAARLARAAQTETAALAARATSLRGVLTRLEKFARSIVPRIKPPLSNKPDNPGSGPAVTPPSRKQPPIARRSPKVPFKTARGSLTAPVIGDIVGKFGNTRPEGGKYEGLRFSVADKAIVTSPFEGKIAFARPWGPVGNLIVLDVGDGYHILLMGVSGFLAEEGQRVRTGEPIGTMSGSNATLELEIRKDGEPVNPSLWLSDKVRNGASF